MAVMSRVRLLVSCAFGVYTVVLVALTFAPTADGAPPSPVWMLVCFVPIGAFLTALLGRRRWWSAVGFGVLGAAWVEAGQTIWMPVGFANGLDVVWGSVGVLVGVVVGLLLLGARGRSMRSHGTPRMVAQGGRREIPRAE